MCSCLSVNWHLINSVWNASVRAEEEAFLYFQKRRKKAYPTNAADLWVEACKPIILAGNQSYGQSYELVKCVTCQGSLAVFSPRGLWIKATSLEQGPLLLWQRRSQMFKDPHLSPATLYSPFFSLYRNEMREEPGTIPGKSGFSSAACVYASFCILGFWIHTYPCFVNWMLKLGCMLNYMVKYT